MYTKNPDLEKINESDVKNNSIPEKRIEAIKLLGVYSMERFSSSSSQPESIETLMKQFEDDT